MAPSLEVGEIELDTQRGHLVKLADFAFLIIDAVLAKKRPEEFKEIHCRAWIAQNFRAPLGDTP